ncbi:GNAT family N-acetyltransferase [Cellulomonas sp. P5_C6]
MSTYLATDRLVLRPFTADEADLLIELDSDPAVMRFLSGGEPTAPEFVRDLVLPSILAGYERWEGRFGLFAAQEKDGGAFVGWFCLRPEREGPLDEVELGYRLRQEAWGKGYATEVASALVGKAFSELDVRVVWGATMSLNLASQKVMEKVDMTVTEILATPDDMLAVEGSELGGPKYEITKEQWERRQSRGQDGSR